MWRQRHSACGRVDTALLSIWSARFTRLDEALTRHEGEAKCKEREVYERI